jgi:hypothetical protein
MTQYSKEADELKVDRALHFSGGTWIHASITASRLDEQLKAEAVRDKKITERPFCRH